MSSNLLDKDLLLLKIKNLPFEVSLHIYSYIDSNNKKDQLSLSEDLNSIVNCLVILFLTVLMSSIGFMITGKFEGFFIVFNFLLGYLVLCGLLLLLLSMYMLFNLTPSYIIRS